MAIYARQLNIPALSSATSANGTARVGSTLATQLVSPESISALCSCSIDTSSVVATFKWQVSNNGTSWYDVSGSSVSSAAGTGSTVASDRVLVAPPQVITWMYCRIVATLSGAATAPADVTSASYDYIGPGGLAGQY